MSPRRKLHRRLVVGDENNDRKQQQQEERAVAPENNDGKQQQQQQEKKQEEEEVGPAPDVTNNNLEEEHQSDSDSSMNSLSKFILKPIGCPGGYVEEDKKWEEDKTNNDNEKEVKKNKNKKSGWEDEKEKDASIAGGRVLVLGLACQEGNNVAPRRGKKIVKALQTGETSGNNVASGKGKKTVNALQTAETSSGKTVKKQKIEKHNEPELKQKGIIVKDEKKFLCLKEYLKVELQEGHRGVVMERLFTLDEKRLEEFDVKCQSLGLTELELSLKRNQLVAEVLRAAGF